RGAFLPTFLALQAIAGNARADATIPDLAHPRASLAIVSHRIRDGVPWFSIRIRNESKKPITICLSNSLHPESLMKGTRPTPESKTVRGGGEHGAWESWEPTTLRPGGTKMLSEVSLKTSETSIDIYIIHQFLLDGPGDYTVEFVYKCYEAISVV